MVDGREMYGVIDLYRAMCPKSRPLLILPFIAGLSPLSSAAIIVIYNRNVLLATWRRRQTRTLESCIQKYFFRNILNRFLKLELEGDETFSFLFLQIFMKPLIKNLLVGWPICQSNRTNFFSGSGCLSKNANKDSDSFAVQNILQKV